MASSIPPPPPPTIPPPPPPILTTTAAAFVATVSAAPAAGVIVDALCRVDNRRRGRHGHRGHRGRRAGRSRRRGRRRRRRREGDADADRGHRRRVGRRGDGAGKLHPREADPGVRRRLQRHDSAEGRGQGLLEFKGERQGRRAYVVGPSSYESNLWLFLRNDGGQWQVYATQPVNADTANLPGAPWPLEKGAKVVVAGTGSCLNVRVAAGTNEAAVDCVADGTEVTLAEGPVEADGFQWWRLEDRSGWVAGDYLRYPEAGAAGTATPASVTPTPAQ